MRHELSPEKVTSLILLIARDLLGFIIQPKFFDEPRYILSTKELAQYITKIDPESHEEKSATKKELDLIDDFLDRSVRIEWLMGKKKKLGEKEERLFMKKVEDFFTMAAALIGYELAINPNYPTTNIAIVGSRLLNVHDEELPPPTLIEHLSLIDDLVWKTLEIDEQIKAEVKLEKRVRKLFLTGLNKWGYSFDKKQKTGFRNILECAHAISERSDAYYRSVPERLHVLLNIDRQVKDKLNIRST